MPAAVVAGLIGAGGAVASSAIQSHTANKAAQTEADSANQALELEKQIYGNTQGQIAPYQNLGVSSLANLAGYANSPGPVMNSTGVGYHAGFTPPQPMTLANLSAPPQGPTNEPTVTVLAGDGSGETRDMLLSQAQALIRAKGAGRILGPANGTAYAGTGRVGRGAMEM